MKEFYISDCIRFENQVVTTSFVVVSKQAKPKKSGELYLALTLADRTGHLDAKMWDNVADHINCFEQDDFRQNSRAAQQVQWALSAHGAQSPLHAGVRG